MLLHQKKGIIFDLDQTLVDTSSFDLLRRERRWHEIYQRLDSLTISFEICDLLVNLMIDQWKVMVVSSAKEEYVQRILNLIINSGMNFYDTKITFDEVIGNAGATALQKKEKFEAIMKSQNIHKSFAYSVGDRQIDIDAANLAGIISIGTSWWNNDPLNDCDLVVSSPEALFENLCTYSPRKISINKYFESKSASIDYKNQLVSSITDDLLGCEVTLGKNINAIIVDLDTDPLIEDKDYFFIKIEFKIDSLVDGQKYVAGEKEWMTISSTSSDIGRSPCSVMIEYQDYYYESTPF